MGSKQQPTWVPDDEAPSCKGCSEEFSFFFRRHHCRRCGGVFCSECSDYFVSTLVYETGSVRVCRSCYTLEKNVESGAGDGSKNGAYKARKKKRIPRRNQNGTTDGGRSNFGSRSSPKVQRARQRGTEKSENKEENNGSSLWADDRLIYDEVDNESSDNESEGGEMDEDVPSYFLATAQMSDPQLASPPGQTFKISTKNMSGELTINRSCVRVHLEPKEGGNGAKESRTKEISYRDIKVCRTANTQPKNDVDAVDFEWRVDGEMAQERFQCRKAEDLHQCFHAFVSYLCRQKENFTQTK